MMATWTDIYIHRHLYKVMALLFEKKVTFEKKVASKQVTQDKLPLNLIQDLFKAQFNSNNN